MYFKINHDIINQIVKLTSLNKNIHLYNSTAIDIYKSNAEITWITLASTLLRLPSNSNNANIVNIACLLDRYNVNMQF